MRQSTRFQEWVRQYKDDPEYITYGLLYEITDAICRAMQEQGLSRSDLAERLGVSRQYITKFLNTPQNTRLQTVVRFATALGLSVKVSLRVKADEMQAGRAARWSDEEEGGADEFRGQVVPIGRFRRKGVVLGDEPREAAA